MFSDQTVTPAKMGRDILNETSLSESDVDSDVEQIELKINQDFAKRFEHNKKREELQKLEEKYGKSSKKRKRGDRGESVSQSEDNSSSDSEDEDDAGELATAALDSEIMATLNAIKSKDPRVYDGKTTFYSTVQEEGQPPKEKADKPLYLRDYHRENLLNGVQIDEQGQPVTYAQEQEQLKKAIVDEMHAVSEDSDEEANIFVAKKREKPTGPSVVVDVESADRDPETFLSNFMNSRAWVPTDKSTWQPLESDDEEEERRAEAYEEAYNMRFEDPNKSNETLRTHARDMAAKYSVRREEQNVRRKKRESEKEKKELEKRQQKEEKARLRKLRIEEVEDKVRKIKQAAGLRTSDIRPEDWSRFVDDDWDDTQWEEEMQHRFGEEYYAGADAMSNEGDDEEAGKNKKPKKPKFDDDIDINDMIPDFKADEGEFSLSEEEEPSPKKKNHKKIKEEKKRDAKKERRIIEQLVDDQLQLELDNSLPGKTTAFRYRETSPQSFGMDVRDILMADDSQLNQFAGLKKLADFRDPDKKRKDRKHLGKKARLRQWRKDTFGNEDGLQDSDLISALPSPKVNGDDDDDDEGGVNIRTTGKKKRRRSKKQKAPAGDAE